MPFVDLSHTVEHGMIAHPGRSWNTCVISALPGRDFKFFAVPAKVAGFGSWPVRALGHVLPSNDRLGLSRRRPSLG